MGFITIIWGASCLHRAVKVVYAAHRMPTCSHTALYCTHTACRHSYHVHEINSSYDTPIPSWLCLKVVAGCHRAYTPECDLAKVWHALLHSFVGMSPHVWLLPKARCCEAISYGSRALWALSHC